MMRQGGNETRGKQGGGRANEKRPKRCQTSLGLHVIFFYLFHYFIADNLFEVLSSLGVEYYASGNGHGNGNGNRDRNRNKREQEWEWEMETGMEMGMEMAPMMQLLGP
jgi:hypothetical protein